jgi:O-antigen/teichoic acid export membrane protein
VTVADTSAAGLFKSSGALFFAMMACNVINYAFHALASRWLGPADYGALVSMLALLTLLAIPGQTVQTVVARHIAVEESRGDRVRSVLLMRRLLFHLSLAGAAGALFFGLGSFELSRFFQIASPLPVAIVGATIVVMLAISLARGWLQGLQKFGALGQNLMADALVRLGAGAALMALGWSVSGALAATALSGSMAFALALFFLPAMKTKPEAPPLARSEWAPVYRDAVPVAGFLSAFMALSSVDVMWVKHFFPPADAGHYGAASMVGKAFVFAGVSMAQVLFPKASASHAQDENPLHLLGKSLGVTALVLLAGLMVVNAAAPSLVRLLFGAAYVTPDTLRLVKGFGLALSPLALAYIFLQYHLAVRHTRFLGWLAADVIVFAGLVWWVHPTLESVLWIAGINHTVLLAALGLATPRRVKERL